MTPVTTVDRISAIRSQMVAFVYKGGINPHELTTEEFLAVRALILEGAEVGGTHLSDYLRSSHRLRSFSVKGSWRALGQSRGHGRRGGASPTLS
jgi:hypothetical protein